MTWQASRGNCYMDAIMAHAEDKYGPKVFLVHGYPHLQKPDQGHPAGTMYGHAWLEVFKQGAGWCCVSLLEGVLLPKDLYYALGAVDEKWVYRYTYHEALAMVDRHGTAGPWEEEPPEAVFSNRTSRGNSEASRLCK